MVDLVEWLRAQLDEDERIARAAVDELDGPELGSDWRYDGQYVETARERTMVAVGSQDLMEPGVGRHVAEHDPARVLREINAKRRTLVRCEEAMLSASPMLVHFAKQTAWEMALPYADRPGYREEWRP